MSECLVLAMVAVALFGPAGIWLERAAWVRRAPRAAIAVWQSIGVAGALASVGAGLALAVAPLHVGLTRGLGQLLQGAAPGRSVPARGMDEAFGLTLAATVVAVLVSGLMITAVGTVVRRRHHRILLDLVSVPTAEAPGTVLLEDPRATAYCLPGVRSRIVVSAGILQLLEPGELAAVVDHERGHVHERHDLVLLPFASMVEMLDWMPYVRRAPRAVAALLEMAADDYAARLHRPRLLASALVHLAGSGPVPQCAFGAAHGSTALRVRRLLDADRTSRGVAFVATAGAALLVLVPLVVVGLA